MEVEVDQTDPSQEIIKHIQLCLLPKLARNYDEIDNHPEYYDRKNVLDEHFPKLLKMVAEKDFEHENFTKNILPLLLLLYFDRSTNKAWNKQNCKDYANSLSKNFLNKYSVPLEEVLRNEVLWDVQDVFDNVLKELNVRVASDDFKKYPSLIEVYCIIIKDVKHYSVIINPIKIFPISLLLIDDFIISNKIKGLKCFSAILQCLTTKHFADGNYYEVLFGSLKKVIGEKDIEVTKLVQGCIIELVKILPADVKIPITDEAFGLMLKQLHLESNLKRKTVCINFVKEMILIHKVNCINKSLMKTVLYDNIQICCNDAVADILLVDVLECLQVWILNCWCSWKLSSDRKILSALIKLLYVSRKEKIATEIQNLIVSLISLCSDDEKKSIHENLEKSTITTPEFKDKLDQIKKDIQC